MEITIAYNAEDIELLKKCLKDSTCIGYADDSIKTTAFKQALNLLKNYKDLKKTIENKKIELSQMEENLTRLEQELTEAGLIDALADETINQISYASDVSEQDEKKQKKYYIDLYLKKWNKLIAGQTKPEKLMREFIDNATAEELAGAFLSRFDNAYEIHHQNIKYMSEKEGIQLHPIDLEVDKILFDVCECKKTKEFYTEKFQTIWTKAWNFVRKKREKGELPQTVNPLEQVINYFNQHADADEMTGYYLKMYGHYNKAYDFYLQDISANKNLTEVEKKAGEILKTFN